MASYDDAIYKFSDDGKSTALAKKINNVEMENLTMDSLSLSLSFLLST